MRILLVHQYFLEKNDGGGSRWNEMACTWANEGHEMTVLGGMVHYNTGLKPEKYKGKYFFMEDYAPGVTVMRTHVSEAYNKNFLGRLWGYFSFVFSSSWAGAFKLKGKYDAVIVTSPPLFIGITGYFLKLIKRCPLIFEVRDLWPESAIDTGVLKSGLIIKFAYWFERFIYRKSKLINTLTPAFREKLIQEKKIDASKVIMIPNAADFSLSEELLNGFNASELRASQGWSDKMVFTYVGAHGVANHLIQVLDAAERLNDTPAHFVLIGAGMQKKNLMEEKRKRSLENVEFIDPVPKKDIFKYILASDIGMSVLKRVDTFKTIYSNKTFDYMSCKKPVLMAIDGVSRELVEDAKAGVYVEPENTDDYVQKIEWLLNNKEKMVEMGTNGYAYAQKHFDRTVLSEKYLKKIQELCTKD